MKLINPDVPYCSSHNNHDVYMFNIQFQEVVELEIKPIEIYLLLTCHRHSHKVYRVTPCISGDAAVGDGIKCHFLSMVMEKKIQFGFDLNLG